MSDELRLIALDALRHISLWITMVDLEDDCDYSNGEGRTDGGNADTDLALIRPKIDAAIAALESDG